MFKAENNSETTRTRHSSLDDSNPSQPPSNPEQKEPITTHQQQQQPPSNGDESGTSAVLVGPKLYGVMGALSLVTLIFSLDTLIVATAIPKITDEFQTVVDIGWYGTAYFLGNCALQPLTGKIYTYFNLTYSYVAFVLIFELGSVVCAAAPSSTAFVIGRAVAGVGSSGMMNGSMTMLGVAAEKEKRPAMMGFLMSIMGLGQIISPLVGGALSEHASWRWCFWINLPCGVAAAIALLFLQVRNPNIQQGLTPKTFVKKFDLIGFCIFAPACIMMLLGVQWGGNQYPWKSATILGLLCASVVAFGFLFFWESRQGDHAMFPGSILKQRVVYSSCLTSALIAGALFLFGYYLSLWFQAIKRDSPTVSALSTLPTFVMQIIAVVISSIAISKIGFFAPFAVSGGILTTLGGGLMATFNADTSMGLWVGFQVLMGTGRGFAFQQPVNAIQAGLSGKQMPTGMAIIAWSQFFGGAMLLGLAQTAFTNILRPAIRQFVPSINPDAVINAGATEYYHLVPDGPMQQALLTAYNQAIVRTFYLGAAAAAVGTITSLGMGWKRVLKTSKASTPDSNPTAEKA